VEKMFVEKLQRSLGRPSNGGQPLAFAQKSPLTIPGNFDVLRSA
jgi:hypothetical protein